MHSWRRAQNRPINPWANNWPRNAMQLSGRSNPPSHTRRRRRRVLSPPPSWHPEQAGPPPAPMPAAPAVPAPLPAERLDYSSDRAPTHQAMAENDVSKEQLEEGNQPPFGSTLSARSEAEKHKATAPARHRQSEAQGQT